MRLLLVLFVLASFASSASAAEPTYLYKAKLIQAAPGKLLDVIDLLKTAQAGYREAGDEQPLLMRHSQGDRWDLMNLIPMNNYVEYYSRERTAKRAKALKELQTKVDELVAWQEDELVRGPDVTRLEGFAAAGLYHIEMFVALAGRRGELVREREMENAYLASLGRPRNAIFVREFGAAWDAFTLGPYRSWKHFAERDDIPPERSAAAARAAGFEGDDRIGPYLRSLIQSHHDTLATPVR